ncbi:MAG: hypothetical protein J7L63_05585 [Thermoplasmata archaeon]|nr:hypothetical protein [Thermoplasmata archaeon]
MLARVYISTGEFLPPFLVSAVDKQEYSRCYQQQWTYYAYVEVKNSKHIQEPENTYYYKKYSGKYCTSR